MMRERNRLASAMEDIRQLESEAQDAVDLWDMAEAEGDKGMFAEVEKSIRAIEVSWSSSAPRSCIRRWAR